MPRTTNKMKINAVMDKDGKITSRLVKGPDAMVTIEEAKKFCEEIAKQLTDFAEDLEKYYKKEAT